MKRKLLLILALIPIVPSISIRCHAQLNETTTVTFQQGVNGYEDTFELLLNANLGTTPGESVQEYFLDGSPFANPQDDKLDVLRFDNIFGNGPSQIPPGATIVNAFVTYGTGTSGSAVTGGPYTVARLIEITDEFSFYEDYPLDPPETRSYRAATARPWVAGVASVQVAEFVDIGITEFVQAWKDGEPNWGILVFANDTTDGWQPITIGNDDPAKRPKLTVEYTTDVVSVRSFPATRSALIRSNVATVDGAGLTAEFLDSAADDVIEALFHFDILGEGAGQIGSQDQVLHAKLVFQTAGAPDYSGDADTADPYSVHQMFVDWDATTTFGVTGPSTVRGDIGEAVDEMVGMGEWTRATANVTSIVSNWKSGQNNYGFNVKPGGSNGWQLFWPGADNPDRVPMLKVWTVAGSGIPKAAITASISEGQGPLTVAFDASGSSDPGGGALQFAWDFADGTQGAGVSVSHEFTASGVFDVSLTVTDADGNQAQAVSTVKVLGSPILNYTLDVDRGPEPLEIRVNASTSYDPDLGPLSFEWDFGDGNRATGDVATHTYTRGGNFTLRLTVTDDEGEQASVTRPIEIFETSIEKVAFQQGANGYEGAYEMSVRGNGGVVFGRDLAEYYVDGRPQDAAQAVNDWVELIRFDGIIGNAPGQVPSGATVVNAKLTFRTGTDGNANSDGPYVIALLNSAIDESTTYESLDAGTGIPEERGPRGSVDRPYLSGYASLDNEEVATADVTDWVQKWVSGEPNLGLAIFTDDTSNGWQITTIGHANVSMRPQLTVEYTTSAVKRHVFETVMSAIAAKTTDELTDGAFLDASFLDGGADADYKEALFLFPDVFGSGADQVGPTRRILSAKLVVQTSGLPDYSSDAASDDPYSVHQMIAPWDLTSTYGAAGVTDSGPEVSAFIGMGEQARAAADVTPILYSWQAGQPNHGFNVKPRGADGWQIFWPGSFDPELAPRMVIFTEEATEPPQPTGPIQISNVRFTSGSKLAVTWVSNPGNRFLIESSLDLSTWTPIETQFPSAGAETTFEIPLTGELVRFLRVQAAGQ